MKDNKLIAEFIMAGDEMYRYFMYRGENIDLRDTDKLPYHKSWEWIMPVVERIQQLGYYTNISYSYGQHIFSIGNDIRGYFIRVGGLDINNKPKSLQQTIYETIVEFAKWYNNRGINGK